MASVSRLLLPRWQAVAAVLYASAFPLAGLVGGAFLTAALFATMPFLLVGYLVGAILVFVFGSEQAYPVGMFIATLTQVWLLLVLWNGREKKS